MDNADNTVYDIKRRDDFERLIRIDENLIALKKTLDSYPPAVMAERIEEQKNKISNVNRKVTEHIDRHWTFWFSCAAPVIIGIILYVVKIQ